MTTASEFQATVDKAIVNMGRLDGIVNGNVTHVETTDGGTVPSFAKILKDIQDEADAAIGSKPVKIDATLGATWTLSHALARVPTVQVFLASGEQIIADVQATNTQIVVSFASAQQGFVLAF